MMDDSDRTTNVSTFQNLFEACERILVLKSDKKQKRNMYCWILWSAYTALVLIVFYLDKYAGLSNSHLILSFGFLQSLLLLGVSGISVCTHMRAKVQHGYCGIDTS